MPWAHSADALADKRPDYLADDGQHTIRWIIARIKPQDISAILTSRVNSLTAKTGE